MKKKFLYCQLHTAHCFLPTVYRLLLTAYCLLPIVSFSQNTRFQTYSTEQGLPQTTVYCIIQDLNGYLWLGTDGGGLCRFDGINFKCYTKKEGFNGSTIRCLLQDSKGRIWAGTKDDGIIIYDGRKFKHIGKANGLAGSTILCLLEDGHGNIWAGSDDGGLNKITAVSSKGGINGGELDFFQIEVIDQQKGLSNNGIFNIHRDKYGHLWLGTFEGLNILSFENGKTNITQLKPGKEIPGTIILSIGEDKAGVLWFGTREEGVFCIKPEEGMNYTRDKVKTYNNEFGFNANKIWDICQTTNSGLWFASSADAIVRKQDLQKNNFIGYTVKDGLPVNMTLCVFEDREKNIWIGTNGGGLCKYKYTGDVFSHYSEKNVLPGNLVNRIDQDSLGNLWLAMEGSGLVKLNIDSAKADVKIFTVKEGLPENTIYGVSAGKTNYNKNVWAATGGYGIVKYNPMGTSGNNFQTYTEKDGLLDNIVYCILTDKNGIVWCGSQEGISRFDGEKFRNMTMESMKIHEKGVFTIIQDKAENLWFGTEGGLIKYSGESSITTFDEAEGLLNKEINCLAEGPDGNIWIGTSKGGIYKLDIHSKEKVKIKFIIGDSLLGTNSIKSLVFQDNNKLLVGTAQGLCRLGLGENEKINSIRNYDAGDGFIGVECNDNAIFKDKNNAIWIGTVKYLTKFNPAAEIENANPAQVHITNLKLFFKEVNWSTKADSVLSWFNLPASLVLPYSDNHLTFEYSGISLSNPKQVKYKYMLEGADKVWSPERKETEITFSGLAPGIYTFKVIAAGANGVWNAEPATFKFTISPPWYRTMLFYIICLIIVVGGVYFFIKYRERALVLEKKILEDKVTERTVEVVKQKEHIEEQKKEITDSINYAKRIQQSILPPLDEVKAAFPNSFILFKPKDIVSGDFYWFHISPAGGGVRQGRTGDVVFIAAADCTGHGVPGAFMSTIGSEKLNEAVAQSNDVGTILQSVNMLMKKVLRQSNKDDSTRDGMDIALCAFHSPSPAGEGRGEGVLLDYAGANRPLWIIRNGSTAIEERKATKTAIGGLTDDKQEFTKHKIDVQKGDTIYLFSDGYADQFGSNDKKLMTKKFKEILLSIQDRTMEQQNIFLDTTIEDWKGDMEQTDDILVIGIKI